jgi:hypothetical protein
LLYTIGLICVAVGSTTAYAVVRGPTQSAANSPIRLLPQEVDGTFVRSDLPEDLGNMRLEAFETVYRPASKLFYGEYSAIWRFNDGGQDIQISIDFPFAGFHALELCYLGSGREMIGDRRSIDHRDYAQGQGYATHLVEEVLLKDQMYGESYLCYAEFDREGNDVWRLGSTTFGSFPARVAYLLKLQPTTFQVQLYATGCGSLTDEQQTRFQHLLLDVCHALLPKVDSL